MHHVQCSKLLPFCLTTVSTSNTSILIIGLQKALVLFVLIHCLLLLPLFVFFAFGHCFQVVFMSTNKSKLHCLSVLPVTYILAHGGLRLLYVQ